MERDRDTGVHSSITPLHRSHRQRAKSKGAVDLEPWVKEPWTGAVGEEAMDEGAVDRGCG